jgi:hypothetical protein
MLTLVASLNSVKQGKTYSELYKMLEVACGDVINVKNVNF